MGACASVTIAVTSMLPPQGDVTVVVVGGVDSTVCNNGLGDFLYLEYYQRIQPQIKLQDRGLVVVMVLFFQRELAWLWWVELTPLFVITDWGGSVPRVLSTNSTPDQASRPRARRRDGFVVSKGGWSGCGGRPITGSITGDNSSKFYIYIWDDQ